VGRQQARTGVAVGALAVLVAAVVVPFAANPAAPAREVVVATGTVVLIALLIIGPTSALGAVESDPDVRLVVAIGAAPALRRRFLGLEAGVQALIASLIGIPAGLLTAMLLMRQLGQSGIVVPWIAASMMAVGLPVAVGAIIALVSRALPVQPPTRRIT
jgi:putative ABC transport system permease protein